MPLSSRRFSFNNKTRCLLVALATSIVFTAGCGMGVGPAAQDTPVAGLSGIVHGGPNAITSATVKLYATATAPYGTASTLLGTTTTDGGGHFTFTGAATCPAGQQAYIVINGGQTGGNADNPESLLMAVLGPCASVSTSTVTAVSEATTVAAGYALSNFMSITGTTVNISAPATNNATTASCTGTGSSMVCNASGLAHAFLNAANLVSATSLDGSTTPSGLAYTTTPASPNTVVPTLLINTLSNVLQACVNSVGGATNENGTDPATSACGKLFTYTTPPTSSTLSALPAPTNTLQAILYLAKYPTMTPTNIPLIFGVATAQTFFAPALAAAPVDYSMAIIHKGPTPATSFYTFFTVLDINDNTYNIGQLGNTGSVGPLRMIAMSSNGSQLYTSPTVGTTTTICAAGSPCAAGVDTLGHIWLGLTVGSTLLNVYEFNTADGTLANTFAIPSGSAPNSAAVDRNNTVYITGANSTSGVSNLFSKATTDSGFNALSVGGVTTQQESVASPEYITVDASGNLWNTNYNTTNLNISYIQNTGTVSAPAFANAATAVTVASGGPGSPYTVMLDASGNAWVNNITTLYKVTPGSTSGTLVGTISAPTTTTNKVAASARFSTLDGDGNIFLPENTPTGIVFEYLAATGNFVYLNPCAGNSGSTCTSSGVRVASPRNAITDSTGSVWVSDPSATAGNGNIAQIIGTGAPTWPQMSYGHPGVRP